MSTNLKYENGAWWTCGCGGKPKSKVNVPLNSVAMQIFKNGQIPGPITGIMYNITPSDICIDIDARDAAYWSENKDGKPFEGQYAGRGRLARIK